MSANGWSDVSLNPKVPMIDATEFVEFIVRPRDIRSAVPRNPEKCVAARGLKRILNGSVKGVKIGAHTAYVHQGTHIERYIISEETKKMIRAYDAAGFYPSGVVVKLRPPSSSVKLGASHHGRVGKKSKGGKNVRSASTPWLRHIGQDPS